MRVLVCGDLHCKPYLLQRALSCTKWDVFVFLGDACDNFGATQEDNINIIKMLIDTKQHYKGRFVWLLGNHDWGYYDGSVDMTGHIHPGEANVYHLLNEYKEMWELFWQKGNFLFSHAGLSSDFARQISDISYLDLKTKPGINNPLNQVGYACGGTDDVPSILWARPSEFTPPETKGLVQVVGHTPVQKITVKDGLVICDTMSQYPDKRFVGDQSLLLIEGDLEKNDVVMTAINPNTGRKMYDVEI